MRILSSLITRVAHFGVNCDGNNHLSYARLELEIVVGAFSVLSNTLS